MSYAPLARAVFRLPLLLLAALSLVCAGCGGGTKSRLLDDGRYVPASWEKAPIQSPGQAGATRPLRYDAIYVHEPFSSPTQYGGNFDPTRWNMDYYRFWPGGQVLKKTRHGREPDASIPGLMEADDFGGRRGAVGRYRLVGDQLTMTFLGYTESGPRWYIRRGVVQPDGTIRLATRGPVLVAREHVVEGMVRQPDW